MDITTLDTCRILEQAKLVFGLLEEEIAENSLWKINENCRKAAEAFIKYSCCLNVIKYLFLNPKKL